MIYEMEVVDIYKGGTYFSSGCSNVDASSMPVNTLKYLCISFTPKLYSELAVSYSLSLYRWPNSKCGFYNRHWSDTSLSPLWVRVQGSDGYWIL